MAQEYKQKKQQQHMLDLQDRLPRLPVPPLDEAINRYLESIIPVAGDDTAALDRTRNLAARFLPIGERLQNRLVNYEKSEPYNWLEKWWLECAYLSWREGLCINSNYWITFTDDPGAYGLANAPEPLVPSDSKYKIGKNWDNKEYSEFQIRRAVNFIQQTLDYKEHIENGRIPIDRTRNGSLCMHQYTCIFGMTRIPRKFCDVLRQDEKTIKSRTIAVIVEDQIYSVNVYDSAGNRKLDGDLEAELFAITQDVIKRRKANDLDPAVTVLTAGHRDRWSDAYEILEKQPKNKETLFAIQESLFVVSLDTTFADPRGSVNAAQIMAKCHGTQPGHNRWYDKCANYMFDRNGSAGYVGEHSPCDALIPALMLHYVASKAEHKKILRDVRSKMSDKYSPTVARLRFSNVGRKVEELILEAEKEMLETTANSVSRQIKFSTYGSDWIKHVAKASPDAFTQLAIQLAYYRVHGHNPSVYETASTRQFLHARTDTTRSLTSEAVRFVKIMSDPQANSLSRYEALIQAAKKHQSVSSISSSGKGIDRHIMGLKLAYARLSPLPGEPPMTDDEKQAIEDFFNDPIMAKSTKFQLSTSGLIPAPYFTHTGFGAVVRECGYGINYIIEPKVIKFGTEGKTTEFGEGTDMVKFEQALRQSMIELKIVCEQATSTIISANSRI